MIFEYKMNRNLLEDSRYQFIKLFKKGKQGITGLLLDKETDTKVVFKMSQHIDYLCEHEETVAKRLNDLECPVFTRLIDSQYMRINPDSDAKHPFVACKTPITRLVLFFEYVRGYSLSKVIKSKKNVETSAILASAKIILLAAKMAHQRCKFTHYDLHTSNIIMTRCDKNRHILFCLDDDNVFSVPTHGWMPKIIDYGFSYVDNIDNGPMYQSLAHTNVGFITCKSDPFTDAKLFLASFSSHAVRYRRSRSVLNLRKFVIEIFGKLNVDLDCGWDQNDEESIADKSLICLESSNNKKDGVLSELFERYDHYAIDLLGSLVLLPLNTDNPDEANIAGMKKSFRIFLKEFSKIEDQILSSFARIQVLKIIIDEARSVMPLYYNKNTQETAWCTFKSGVCKKIDQIARMVNLSKIDFERMLCSLVLFSREYELFLSNELVMLLNRKNSEYIENLSITDTIEIVGAIELEIRTDRVVDNQSEWLVCVPFKEPYRWKPQNSQIKNINTTHPLTRGTCISKLL